MKKVLVASLLICTLFVAGCGNKVDPKEEAMKEYSIKYYELHQKGIMGLTNPTVSIEELKKAMEITNDEYDLSKLDGCADSSSVELQLDENREVTDVIYHMECN